MKDDKLKEKFGEYFESATLPEGITDDAKKYVRKRGAFFPVFVKIASTAACAVLVLGVTLGIYLGSGGFKAAHPDSSGNLSYRPGAPDKPNADGDEDVSGDNSTPPAQETELPDTYTDAHLSFVTQTADGLINLDKNLEFLAAFPDGSVKECYAGYANGTLTLVRAEVRTDGESAMVYVEYTRNNKVYEPLVQYKNGERNVLNGVPYRLTRTADANQTYFHLFFENSGVKYYFKILSERAEAYEKYINAVINKNF